MVKIEAIFRHHRLSVVRTALAEIGLRGFHYYDVMGTGQSLGGTEIFDGREISRDALPKVKLVAVVNDEEAEKVLQVIAKAAQMGDPGSGKIFVSDVREALRIRTGERGRAAILASAVELSEKPSPDGPQLEPPLYLSRWMDGEKSEQEACTRYTILPVGIVHNLSAGLVDIPPGGNNDSRPHFNKRQVYFVLEGEGTFFLEDKEAAKIEAGIVVEVPVGVRHVMKADRGSRVRYIYVEDNSFTYKDEDMG